MLGKLKRPLYFIVILIAAGLAGAVGKEVAASFSKPNNQEFLRTAIQDAVKKINAGAPVKVDEVTTLLRAEQEGPGTMVTYFQLAQYESWGRSADLSAGKASVIKSLCSKPQTVKVMRMGATFGYVYVKEDGKQVYRFNVGKADCL